MPTPRIRIVLLATALVVIAAGHARSDDIERGARTASGSAQGRRCRAPAEPGCGTCCRELLGGRCERLAWTGGPESETTPWYNSTMLVDRCPEACPPCARCLARDAEELKALASRKPADCDCATTDIGVDPCHAPTSCACFCDRHRRLTEKCGE
jgi:hypothetical protein